MKNLAGGEIETQSDTKEYLHQIISVVTFLGEVTKAMVQDTAERTGGYSRDGDFGHYLAFNMITEELKKFGELTNTGYAVEEYRPEKTLKAATA